jgi:hypothetical protein
MLPLRPSHILTFMQRAPDIATCMDSTGVDPFTGREVYVARHLRDRRLQRQRPDRAVRGDHSHTVANPARGEPAGERGLAN